MSDDRLKAGPQVPVDPQAAAELMRAAREAQAESGRARPLPGGVVVRDDPRGERYEALGAREDAAPILYLHGGAYVLGSLGSHATLAARLAAAARRPVVVARYRQAPEHPYPAGLDDVTACLRELGEGALLAGDSAGGGLALALALRLRDAGEPLPAAIVLVSPWVDLAADACWRAPAADGDLDPSQLAIAAQAYAGAAALDDPGLSPARAPSLAGLPPLAVHVGGAELLRADVERFAARARAAGVAVELHVADGCPHVWHMQDSPAADEALAALGAWLDAAQPPGTATPGS